MLKKFLEAIQNSDEPTKKRWLVGLSAFSMILIIGLWLIYFNFTIQKMGTLKEEAHQIGFWRIFKNGLAATGDSIVENIKSLISKTGEEIKKQRIINIE